MHVGLRKFSRQFHLWAALAVFLPILVVVASGLLLQLKKELHWIQPSTIQGAHTPPEITFDDVLSIARQSPQAEIQSWADINKLDVRPNKGIIKVQANNHWEIQIDSVSGKILQTAYRRSDIIESIHDGSWFFNGAKLGLFLPSAIVLFLIWLSGVVLLYTTLKSKYRKKRYRSQSK